MTSSFIVTPKLPHTRQEIKDELGLKISLFDGTQCCYRARISLLLYTKR